MDLAGELDFTANGFGNGFGDARSRNWARDTYRCGVEFGGARFVFP
jgi:hypothetical protein